MCTYFSCWISFFAVYTLSFIFVFPMQLKRKCSQITHMQNEWVGKSGAEAEDWSTGSDPASFAISVAPHISSMKALGLRHSRLLTLPQDATNPSQASCCCPFLIPSRFCGKLALTCGSSSVTIERQRNQSREEAIKAYDFIQRKRAARTSWKNAFFGKRTSCLSEKLLGKYLERYILYKPYWRISI